MLELTGVSGDGAGLLERDPQNAKEVLGRMRAALKALAGPEPPTHDEMRRVRSALEVELLDMSQDHSPERLAAEYGQFLLKTGEVRGAADALHALGNVQGDDVSRAVSDLMRSGGTLIVCGGEEGGDAERQ